MRAWADYARAKTFHFTSMAGLPSPWGAKLSPFQRLLVLRTLRPEKAVHGMAEVVEKTLGPKFARAPPFDLDEVVCWDVPF